MGANCQPFKLNAWGVGTLQGCGCLLSGCMERQRLAGLAEIAELLGGVSRQRASEIIRRPTFPEPIDILATGRIWDRADVIAWIREHRPHQQAD
ncbi:hypothetical protein GCM10011608_27970 [Micromonospora sonchi]|uniref:Uncharacterized protein n=2 Tax=Micromonospora sonchi TaxID=1763543 RepID=A0A917WXA4_9ACTN|nr:hypothetical protein GCM10011608_27970 [Micromonospora sonchi]